MRNDLSQARANIVFLCKDIFRDMFCNRGTLDEVTQHQPRFERTKLQKHTVQFLHITFIDWKKLFCGFIKKWSGEKMKNWGLRTTMYKTMY